MPPGVEIFAGLDVLVPGGLGFIGSALVGCPELECPCRE
jgi:hypothetical protein